MNILDEAFKNLNEKEINEAARAFGCTYDDLYDEVMDALSPVNGGDMNKNQLARYRFLHCFAAPAYDNDAVVPAGQGDGKEGFNTIKIQSADPARADEVARAFGLKVRPGIRKDTYFIDIPGDTPVMKEFADGFVPADVENTDEAVCPKCGKEVCECKDEVLREDYDEFGIPYDNAEYELDEVLNEDVQSSIPVTPLPREEVWEFVMNIPAPTGNRPPRFFKCGYITELGSSKIAAKYRGGRGSTDEDPRVRIFKCIEYSQLMTGIDYKKTKHTKEADIAAGDARHTGEKTGFSYDTTVEGEDFPRIGHYANGEEALQVTLTDGCITRVKFFISLNDEDLREASKDEVAQYLTPGEANKILNGREKPVIATREDGSAVTDTPVNRLKLAGIYMIGGRGHSVM